MGKGPKNSNYSTETLSQMKAKSWVRAPTSSLNIHGTGLLGKVFPMGISSETEVRSEGSASHWKMRAAGDWGST